MYLPEVHLSLDLTQTNLLDFGMVWFG